MSTPAFGDCRYDDDTKIVVFEGDHAVDVEHVVVGAVKVDTAQPGAVPLMGPPLSAERADDKTRKAPRPKVLEPAFDKSASSVGGSSSSTVVADASASQSSSAVKRVRAGEVKQEAPAPIAAMEVEADNVSGTTAPAPDDDGAVSGDSDEQEGRANRARQDSRVTGGPDAEAAAALQAVQEQLKSDVAEWRSSFLGEDYKLQPKGMPRGLEHPGGHSCCWQWGACDAGWHRARGPGEAGC